MKPDHEFAYLPPCPFCGHTNLAITPGYLNEKVTCMEQGCPIQGHPILVAEWKYRPIEASLNREINRLTVINRAWSLDRDVKKAYLN